MVKVLVIGIDGAGWDLIQPWIEEGELPNIAKLIREGVSGPLKSCFPPVTCPAWKCYSTGKWPGNLGVFWWLDVDWKNKRMPSYNSLSFKSREIWDYLNDAGLRTGIINMPTTYPVKAVDGFMIASWWASEGDDYTYPASLKREIKKKYGYRIKPNILPRDKERTSKEIYDIITKRFRLAKDMLLNERIDFLHLTIFYINTLHHFYWDDEVTKKAWRIIDKNIGELINDEIHTFIISDHGSIKIKATFFINSWLEKRGYLTTKTSLTDLFRTLGVNQEDILSLLDRFKLANFVKRIVPQSLKKKVPRSGSVISGRDIYTKIDWERTRVIATGQGPIYINKEKVGNRYETLREQLIQELSDIRDPFTSERITIKVYRKEEIYPGEYQQKAPDLFLSLKENYYISGGLNKECFDFENTGWIAENKELGIFIACGPMVKKNEKIKNVQIVDLAPTILHLLNIPIPKDMDGKVLKGIFKEDSDVAMRNLALQEPVKQDEKGVGLTMEEESEIKERLKELGYLG